MYSENDLVNDAASKRCSTGSLRNLLGSYGKTRTKNKKNDGNIEAGKIVEIEKPTKPSDVGSFNDTEDLYRRPGIKSPANKIIDESRNEISNGTSGGSMERPRADAYSKPKLNRTIYENKRIPENNYDPDYSRKFPYMYRIKNEPALILRRYQLKPLHMYGMNSLVYPGRVFYVPRFMTPRSYSLRKPYKYNLPRYNYNFMTTRRPYRTAYLLKKRQAIDKLNNQKINFINYLYRNIKEALQEKNSKDDEGSKYENVTNVLGKQTSRKKYVSHSVELEKSPSKNLSSMNDSVGDGKPSIKISLKSKQGSSGGYSSPIYEYVSKNFQTESASKRVKLNLNHKYNERKNNTDENRKTLDNRIEDTYKPVNNTEETDKQKYLLSEQELYKDTFQNKKNSTIINRETNKNEYLLNPSTTDTDERDDGSNKMFDSKDLRDNTGRVTEDFSLSTTGNLMKEFSDKKYNDSLEISVELNAGENNTFDSSITTFKNMRKLIELLTREYDDREDTDVKRDTVEPTADKRSECHSLTLIGSEDCKDKIDLETGSIEYSLENKKYAETPLMSDKNSSRLNDGAGEEVGGLRNVEANAFRDEDNRISTTDNSSTWEKSEMESRMQVHENLFEKDDYQTEADTMNTGRSSSNKTDTDDGTFLHGSVSKPSENKYGCGEKGHTDCEGEKHLDTHLREYDPSINTPAIVIKRSNEFKTHNNVSHNESSGSQEVKEIGYSGREFFRETPKKSEKMSQISVHEAGNNNSNEMAVTPTVSVTTTSNKESDSTPKYIENNLNGDELESLTVKYDRCGEGDEIYCREWNYSKGSSYDYERNNITSVSTPMNSTSTFKDSDSLFSERLGEQRNDEESSGIEKAYTHIPNVDEPAATTEKKTSKPTVHPNLAATTNRLKADSDTTHSYLDSELGPSTNRVREFDIQNKSNHRPNYDEERYFISPVLKHRGESAAKVNKPLTDGESSKKFRDINTVLDNISNASTEDSNRNYDFKVTYPTAVTVSIHVNSSKKTKSDGCNERGVTNDKDNCKEEKHLKVTTEEMDIGAVNGKAPLTTEPRSKKLNEFNEDFKKESNQPSNINGRRNENGKNYFENNDVSTDANFNASWQDTDRANVFVESDVLDSKFETLFNKHRDCGERSDVGCQEISYLKGPVRLVNYENDRNRSFISDGNSKKVSNYKTRELPEVHTYNNASMQEFEVADRPPTAQNTNSVKSKFGKFDSHEYILSSMTESPRINHTENHYQDQKNYDKYFQKGEFLEVPLPQYMHDILKKIYEPITGEKNSAGNNSLGRDLNKLLNKYIDSHNKRYFFDAYVNDTSKSDVTLPSNGSQLPQTNGQEGFSPQTDTPIVSLETDRHLHVQRYDNRNSTPGRQVKKYTDEKYKEDDIEEHLKNVKISPNNLNKNGRNDSFQSLVRNNRHNSDKDVPIDSDRDRKFKMYLSQDNRLILADALKEEFPERRDEETNPSIIPHEFVDGQFVRLSKYVTDPPSSETISPYDLVDARYAKSHPYKEYHGIFERSFYPEYTNKTINPKEDDDLAIEIDHKDHYYNRSLESGQEADSNYFERTEKTFSDKSKPIKLLPAHENSNTNNELSNEGAATDVKKNGKPRNNGNVERQPMISRSEKKMKYNNDYENKELNYAEHNEMIGSQTEDDTDDVSDDHREILKHQVESDLYEYLNSSDFNGNILTDDSRSIDAFQLSDNDGIPAYTDNTIEINVESRKKNQSQYLNIIDDRNREMVPLWGTEDNGDIQNRTEPTESDTISIEKFIKRNSFLGESYNNTPIVNYSVSVRDKSSESDSFNDGQKNIAINRTENNIERDALNADYELIDEYGSRASAKSSLPLCNFTSQQFLIEEQEFRTVSPGEGKDYWQTMDTDYRTVKGNVDNIGPVKSTKKVCFYLNNNDNLMKTVRNPSVDPSSASVIKLRKNDAFEMLNEQSTNKFNRQNIHSNESSERKLNENFSEIPGMSYDEFMGQSSERIRTYDGHTRARQNRDEGNPSIW